MLQGSSASGKSNALKWKNRPWKESSGFANGMPVEDIAATRIQTAFRAYMVCRVINCTHWNSKYIGLRWVGYYGAILCMRFFVFFIYVFLFPSCGANLQALLVVDLHFSRGIDTWIFSHTCTLRYLYNILKKAYPSDYNFHLTSLIDKNGFWFSQWWITVGDPSKTKGII